jgi:ABC-2 type transport system permease protein
MYSLKRVRMLVIAMSLLLSGFQVLLIAVAGSIQKNGSFDQLGELIPPFFRQLLGPSFISLMSFSGIISVGYFHLAVMGSLVGLSIALGTTVTSEIETGFIDLIMSRPIARHWIISRSIIVMLLSTVSVLAMMMIGTWAGLNLLAPPDAVWPTNNLILALALNLGLLMVCWNSLSMAIGAASRRRSVAGAVAGLVALATFLLDYVARAWEPAESIAWLSPFRYYSPFDLVMGSTLSTKNLIVLFAISVCSFSLAYVIFRRRDI